MKVLFSWPHSLHSIYREIATWDGKEVRRYKRCNAIPLRSDNHVHVARSLLVMAKIEGNWKGDSACGEKDHTELLSQFP